MRRTLLSALMALAALAPACPAADEPTFSRKEDVIYGRKYGTALTLDVFTPRRDARGVGLIFVVSGGWYSAHEAIALPLVEPLVRRGYTVFAVVHGSQPKFTIPEVLADMNRAVRFIRHHAADYGIDPGRIGIYGGSAGGHLSLMQGTAGEAGDPKAKDPVDRESSRVQAVACFFPPTDFLNYGKPGHDALGRGTLKGFPAPFDFHELSPEPRKFVPIVDPARVREIGRRISPITHASGDDPPTLIVHGDADTLVPIQQAEIMVGALKDVGVEAKLVVKPGAGHGWPDMAKDLETFADWFDAHLKPAHGGEDAAQATARGHRGGHFAAEMNARFADPGLDVEKFAERFASGSREIAARRREIVEAAGLRPGMAVADIGAGTGLFTWPFAERVGPEGRVYAVEVAPAFLKYLGDQAQQRGLGRVVRPVRSTQEATNLDPGSIDVAFVCATYHHFEHPAKMLESIHRTLRPGGRLVVIDFDLRDDSPAFVREHARAPREVYFNEIQAAGFAPVEVQHPPALKDDFFAAFRRTEPDAAPPGR